MTVKKIKIGEVEPGIQNEILCDGLFGNADFITDDELREYEIVVVRDMQSYVASTVKNWWNSPPVQVVYSVADLPFDARPTVQGIYHDGAVYLIAGNIRSNEEAQCVLMHEVFGHAGIRGLLGSQMIKKLVELSAKNKGLAEDAARWREGNKWQSKGRTEAEFIALSIEEVLANMAEMNLKFGKLRYFHAGTQKLLRKLRLDGIANLIEDSTDSEVLLMITKARSHIVAGANRNPLCSLVSRI